KESTPLSETNFNSPSVNESSPSTGCTHTGENFLLRTHTWLTSLSSMAVVIVPLLQLVRCGQTSELLASRTSGGTRESAVWFARSLLRVGPQDGRLPCATAPDHRVKGCSCRHGTRQSVLMMVRVGSRRSYHR